MSVSQARIRKNLQRIREDISAACERSGRAGEEIRIVAVTKSVDVQTIKAVLGAGLLDIGESRVQQLTARAAELEDYLKRHRPELVDKVCWHMVGHLQRNKVKAALECAAVIHSVDSLRLAEEINLRAERAERVVDVLLQVNCSQESQKQGVAVGAAMSLAELICTMRNVRLRGLMTMAPLAKDPEQARPTFVRLRELFEEMRHEGIGRPAFNHMSIGMSQDYTVAVEEGATIVRIGTALFE